MRGVTEVKKREILSRIDHTELRPNATTSDFERLFEEAKEYAVAAVCVPPNVVAWARMMLPETINVCTVVGFPLGYCTMSTKVTEAWQAITDGADEIDMVVNISRAVQMDSMSRGVPEVRHEIEALREVCNNGIILKVIAETCYLNEEQKCTLCKTVSDIGVDFIKTSTGFGPRGAELADIRLFKKYLGPDVKIKAAGGISTIEAAKEFITAGCERIGSSRLVRLLEEVDGDEV